MDLALAITLTCSGFALVGLVAYIFSVDVELREARKETAEHDVVYRRGYVIRRSDGSMREETDAEFGARIIRGDQRTPGLTARVVVDS